MSDLYKVAVGALGISPDYFLDTMSDRGYYLALEGYNERIKREWEQTRIIAYYSIAPHLKQKKSVHSILPFEWDNDKPKKAPTKEDFDRLKKLAGEKYGLAQ